LEEIKVPFKPRDTTIRLYDNFTTMFRNINGYLREVNYNIGSKHVCPLSPTLFGLYIDKLEHFLEETSYVGPILCRIVLIFLVYNDYVVFVVRSPYDIVKKLIIPKVFSPIWVRLLILTK
jgi:hypothetical protein